MNNFCPPPLPANTHWIVSCFGLQPVTYASCGLEPPRVPAAIDSEQGPSCLQVDSVVHLFRSWPFLLMSRVSKAGVKNIVHVQAAAALPMRRQSLTIYLSTNSKRLPRRARPPSELVLGRFTGSRQSDLQGCLGPCCRVEGRKCLERTRTQAVSLVAEDGSHEAHEVKAAPTAAHGAYEAYNVGQGEPPSNSTNWGK